MGNVDTNRLLDVRFLDLNGRPAVTGHGSAPLVTELQSRTG